MRMPNAIIAASIAAVFGLGISGLAMADDQATADNASAAASDDSTASADNSNEAQNRSAVAGNDANIEANRDSYNDNSDSSDNSIADSGNTTVSDSGNDSSDNSIDLDLAVAASELSGEVSGNSMKLKGKARFSGDNVINGGSFAEVSGITQISQNSGSNALTQQNTTVQSNLSFD